jgi:two-component system chemotaxis sensor kinase CheA
VDEGQLLRQFVAESEEIVEALARDLDALAAQHAGGRPSPELLNRVFRSAHSLKGMAGMAGVGSVGRAAHRFEDLLDDLRMGRVRADGALIAGCARIAEELAEMVAAVARGRAPEAEADRVDAAVDAIRAATAAETEIAVEDLVDLDDRVRATLTEYEEHRLRDNLRERRPVYEVRVSFDFASFDTGFRALSDALAAAGEVVSTLPGAADDPLRIAFRVVYASDAPVEEIRRVLAPSGGELALISRYPEPAAEPARAAETAAPDGASSSVRVDIEALDGLSVLAEALALRAAEIAATCDSMAERLGLGARERFELRQQTRAIERGFAELEERLVDARLVPLAPTFARARRRVLKVAADLGREVECVLEGDEVRLDKAIVDRIADPLAHLLHNAVDHGVEPPETREAGGKPARGRVVLRAEPRGNRVAVSVSDDGPGVDVEALSLAAAELGVESEGLGALFHPGLSTAGRVSAVSGRGVGLDAVAVAVAALGGEVDVENAPGSGATFTMTLPTTLVMASTFLVESGGATYAVDVNQLSEIGLVEPAGVTLTKDGAAAPWRGRTIPFFRLSALVRASAEAWEPPGRLPCLIARVGDRLAAISVDRFVGEREAVVKSLGRHASRIRGVGGAVDLEGGRVALLLDLPTLVGERRRGAGGRA